MDAGIQLVPGKLRDGSEGMVKPYDWEDGYKEKLEGKFVQMRVRGVKLDTTYSFKEVPEFLIANEVAEAFADEVTDMPF